MGYQKRLSKAFQKAQVLPLYHNSRLVLMSDCHRGCGNSNDNFLKNQHLFFHALSYYFAREYTYIELGDGDELWENRNFSDILEIHGNIFWLFELFHKQNRIYMLYGNHDMEKKYRSCPLCFCCQEALILKDCCTSHCFYLTHGHQADTLNSTFWKLSRFLVRYLWKPFESFGIPDPTSAAKNYSVKDTTEKRLEQWAKKQNITLITGHTHRSVLSEDHPHYINTGSCVHPRCITCLEIANNALTLVKWCMESKPDGTLYVARKTLTNAMPLQDFYSSAP